MNEEDAEYPHMKAPLNHIHDDMVQKLELMNTIKPPPPPSFLLLLLPPPPPPPPHRLHSTPSSFRSTRVQTFYCI